MKNLNIFFKQKWIFSSVLCVFIVSTICLYLHFDRFRENLVEEISIENAAAYAKILESFRTLYTSEIVVRAKKNGLSITHDYKKNPNSLPLPATMTKLLGKQIASYEKSGGAKLYSGLPFPQDQHPDSEELTDKFSKDAWAALQKNPSQPFYRIETVDGIRTLRYAQADVMRESCIECHNSHPNTPKTDWKVGDVRGVLEVLKPLAVVTARTEVEARNGLLLIILTGATGAGGLLSLLYVLGRLKKREQRLATFKKFMDSSRDSFFVVDGTTGRIKDANKTAHVSLGLTREELLKKQVPDISNISPKEFAQLPKQIGPGGVVLESEHIRKDGSTFPVEISIHPVEDNLSPTLIGIARDISDRQVLRNTEKMAAVGEMAGGIAHEVNTPLAAILLATDAIDASIKNEAVDRESVLELTQIVRGTTKRIARIVQALRSISRDDSRSPFVESSILELVEDVLSLCSEKFRSRGIDLHFNPEGFPTESLQCRPAQISQVLINLINNAADAVVDLNQENTWISVKTEIENDTVHFLIQDAGKGVPNSVKQKIFQPFFTTKEIGKGTGLGLSISANILKSHSGVLTLDENQLNTTFRVSLPLKQKTYDEGEAA